MSAFAVITGGGTSGHVLPAIAVAESLEQAGITPDRLHYVGSQRGIETRLVPPTGYRHDFLDVVGFQRSFDRRNLSFGPKMIRATRAANMLLADLDPKVVVTVGGYASMPTVFAARRRKIPIVVVSYDMRPGRASALTARFAAASAVAYPNSPLPRAILTGAPVRRELLELDRSATRTDARARLAIPNDRFVISVMGGSLGSGALNKVIDEYLTQHRHDRSLAIRHVTGERFLDAARPPLDGADGVIYQPIGYESDMAAVYAASDLLIGRGGASTTHEVAVTGIPAILVPWADATDDHQTLNVAWLADDGAAVAIAESDLDRATTVIDRLRANPDELHALSAAAARKGEVHRQGVLADLIVRAAGI